MSALCKRCILVMVAILACSSVSQAKFPLTKAFIIDPWFSGVAPGLVDVVVDGKNQIHVVWQNNTSASGVGYFLYYCSYDVYGEPLTDVRSLTVPGYVAIGVVSIACNSQGKLAIACNMNDTLIHERHPYLWLSDPTGQLGSPFQLGLDRLPHPFGPRPALAVSEAGRTIVAWSNSSINNGDSVYYEMYDEDNQKMVPSHAASTGDYYCNGAQDCKVAVAPSGRFAITWSARHTGDPNWPFSDWQPSARAFDADGNPMCGEILVACEGFPETCSGDTAYFSHGMASGNISDVAIQDNGDFVVSYRRDNSFDCAKEFYFLRRYNADGTPKGPNIPINDQTNCMAWPEAPRIASDSIGNLLVVFQVNIGLNSDSWNNFGQRFEPTGARMGGNYRINDVPATEAATSIRYFSADMNRAGLVAMVWWDWGSLAPRWNLIMQIMDVSDIGYKCGDANDDKHIDVADAIYLIDYIFTGGYAPKEICLGDGSGDGVVDIMDAVTMISYIFQGGDITGKCLGQ
jgi:hypothetical protein